MTPLTIIISIESDETYLKRSLLVYINQEISLPGYNSPLTKSIQRFLILKNNLSRYYFLLHLSILIKESLSVCNARFTLADPMPRLCPDAVGSANVNGLPTRNRLSEPHREAIARSSGNIKHVYYCPIGSAVREVFHRGMMHGNQSRSITVTMAISRMFQICCVFENVSLATRSCFHCHVQL